MIITAFRTPPDAHHIRSFRASLEAMPARTRPIEVCGRFLYTTAMCPVSSVLLLTKTRNPAVQAAAVDMLAWFSARGVSGRTVDADAPQNEVLAAAAGTDAVIVLGGDGTFVGAGRKLAESGLPLLGINFGHVGFLTAAAAQNWQETFEKLLAGRLCPVPRLTLEWRVQRDGRTADSGRAVNDVIAGRGALARILSLNVHANEQFLGRVRCDGIIVSAPAGTSGYALSAGGALVHPDLAVLSLTAVSPFLNAFPPCVLPADCLIRLEVAAGANDAFLTVDGQDGLPLNNGDDILVRAVPKGLIVLTADRDAYLRRLRECGFVCDGGAPPTKTV